MNVTSIVVWRRSWFTALIETLAATLFSAVVVGAQFLPNEVERLQDAPSERARACMPLEQGSVVVSFVESTDARSPSVQHNKSVRWYDLNDRGSLQRTLALLSNVDCLAFDPSGSRLFVSDSDGAINVVQTEERGWAGELLGHVIKGSLSDMACTQNGKILLTLDISGLAAWDIDLNSRGYGRPHWYLIDKHIDCFAAYPNASGGLLGMHAAGGSRLVEFDMKSGERSTIAELAGRLTRIVVSPDGNCVVAVNDTGAIDLYRRQSTESAWLPEEIPGIATGESSVAAFSPEGDVLITSAGCSRRMVAWDLPRKQIRHLFDTQPAVVVGCKFLDKDRAVFWGLDNKLRILSVERADIEQQVEL